MTQEKLNEYILQYIKEDKTKSAIILKHSLEYNNAGRK